MAVVVFLSSMAVVLFVAHWSMLNWRVWACKVNGKVWSFTARCVRWSQPGRPDIGIQAMAAIPVGAAGEGIGESDARVNFGGVTFFSGDHLYADNTGIVLRNNPLDIE